MFVGLNHMQSRKKLQIGAVGRIAVKRILTVERDLGHCGLCGQEEGST